MADSTSTLRNRRHPTSNEAVPAQARDTRKPVRGTTSGILALFFLFLGVVALLALAGAAAAYIYYQNPGGYFWPKPQAPWVAVPGETEWTVDFSADLTKRDTIVAAFKHAWSAYERDAMGDDEYHPITKKGSNLTDAGGIGYTVIDSIDTMLLMGLEDEYARARKWVETSMSFDRDANFNTFETTIRVLGGLLSAYELTDGDELYLERAVDLADRLLPVFDTPSGLPYSQVNLAQRVGVADPDNRGLVSTAEASTLQLEFRYLGFLTDNLDCWDKAENVMKVIRRARLPNALTPIFMSSAEGKFMTSEIRLGSRGDSYYEYLKQYLQTGSIETVYRDMYDDSMQAIHENLIATSNKRKLIHTVEIHPRRLAHNNQMSWVRTLKQDHLVCFLGGSLMLGATTAGARTRPVSVPPRIEELSPVGRRDWTTGVGLIETCVDTYRTASGLSPEIVHFRESIETGSDWFIKDAKPPGELPVYDARYILRPETVESLFLAWRLTGNPKYRTYGWDIFQAIETHCRVPSGGYASVLNVEQVPVTWEDKMETFLMSETLKYLYLLFSDNTVLPLDQYVFNTEAHPLPIFSPTTVRSGFNF
ncbi:glycoside hydrolase family 47 protein [Mycena alexandri]|uniref:alpha-1,2-Mannosidase n=1 Tax=Mycena alexandri TaxID=1745969 RepID=A0AAD6WKF3_9AGAR|nr:glycoside hydrolase family 47 protein [Mycena alexandri]